MVIGYARSEAELFYVERSVVGGDVAVVAKPNGQLGMVFVSQQIRIRFEQTVEQVKYLEGIFGCTECGK